MSGSCRRELLSGYLENRLELEDQLDFLSHVDECPRCWEEVYNATKAQHPHYYKNTSRQVKLTTRELEQDSGLREDVFEVA